MPLHEITQRVPVRRVSRRGKRMAVALDEIDRVIGQRCELIVGPMDREIRDQAAPTREQRDREQVVTRLAVPSENLRGEVFRVDASDAADALEFRGRAVGVDIDPLERQFGLVLAHYRHQNGNISGRARYSLALAGECHCVLLPRNPPFFSRLCAVLSSEAATLSSVVGSAASVWLLTV